MRSLLFVPGDSERKISKALATGADALILDLEDSVAADRKPAARGMTREFLAAAPAAGSRPRLYVRINALDTVFWEGDVAEVVKGRPDGILLPKTRSGEDVHRLSVALGHLEEQAGIPAASIKISAIATEIAISLLDMKSYIGASSRLEALTWGAEDLSADLGARATREADGRFTSPFRLARDLCLFTAVAAGVQPLDTVFANFRDTATFERECAEAARDGFTGKLAIHPDQVAPINAAFTPPAEEIEKAKTIVALFAANPDAGVVSHNGEMFDRPHLTRAERLLARAGRRA